MPDPIDDSRQLIQSCLDELDAETEKLERALASLGDGSRTLRRRPGRPRGAASLPAPDLRTARRPGAKRARRGQRREQLLATIAESPGTCPSDLAKKIGIEPAQLHALIAKVRAEKLIVKRGKGYALKA
jgi:hypothetical protein